MSMFIFKFPMPIPRVSFIPLFGTLFYHIFITNLCCTTCASHVRLLRKTFTAVYKMSKY